MVLICDLLGKLPAWRAGRAVLSSNVRAGPGSVCVLMSTGLSGATDNFGRRAGQRPLRSPVRSNTCTNVG